MKSLSVTAYISASACKNPFTLQNLSARSLFEKVPSQKNYLSLLN